MSKFWQDDGADSDSSDDDNMHILELVGNAYGNWDEYKYHNGEKVKPVYKIVNNIPGCDNYRLISYISETHQPYYRDKDIDKRERRRLKNIYFALLGEKYNRDEIISIFYDNKIKVNGLEIIALKDVKEERDLFYRKGYFTLVRNSSGYLCDIYHG